MALVKYKLIQATSLNELEKMVNVAYDAEVRALPSGVYDDVNGLNYFVAGSPTMLNGVFMQWMVNHY